jgi:hypothetical protein
VEFPISFPCQVTKEAHGLGPVNSLPAISPLLSQARRASQPQSVGLTCRPCPLANRARLLLYASTRRAALAEHMYDTRASRLRPGSGPGHAQVQLGSVTGRQLGSLFGVAPRAGDFLAQLFRSGERPPASESGPVWSPARLGNDTRHDGGLLHCDFLKRPLFVRGTIRVLLFGNRPLLESLEQSTHVFFT